MYVWVLYGYRILVAAKRFYCSFCLQLSFSGQKKNTVVDMAEAAGPSINAICSLLAKVGDLVSEVYDGVCKVERNARNVNKLKLDVDFIKQKLKRYIKDIKEYEWFLSERTRETLMQDCEYTRSIVSLLYDGILGNVKPKKQKLWQAGHHEGLLKDAAEGLDKVEENLKDIERELNRQLEHIGITETFDYRHHRGKKTSSSH